MTRTIPFLLLCLFLVSCEKEQDSELEKDPKDHIFIDCLLNPDSTVTLKAYYAFGTLIEIATTPILDGEFILSNNGLEWGVLEHQQNGIYTLQKYPEIGESYTLQAKIGNQTYFASTTIPNRPQIEYTIIAREKQKDGSSKLSVEYHLLNTTKNSYYWNYERNPKVKYESPQSTSVYIDWYEEQISSYSAHTDNFNKIIDETNSLGYYYKLYTRHFNEELDGLDIQIIKSALNSNHIDCFIHADEQYDKYMKSMIDTQILKHPNSLYSSYSTARGVFGATSCYYIDYNTINLSE